jgi:hypothetical protein
VARMVATAEVVDPVREETERLEDSYRRLCDELRNRGYLAAPEPGTVPTQEN